MSALDTSSQPPSRPAISDHVISGVISRLPHSDQQKTQADEVVNKAQDLDAHYSPTSYTQRRRVVTHAIDNVTPDIAADRDDGIFVERMEGGGYRVSVTIADVAGHVPMDSPLAMVASNRAFTRYRPEEFGGNDPMFPADAEGAMSLEHDRECLGLSVVMELDEQYQLKHTSFEPVIATPDNVSYDMAAERIAAGDEQFTLMKDVADHIFRDTFGGNRRLLKDAMELGDPNKPLDERGMKAAMMVASYMLLANHAAASFFEQTDLPFSYRIFDGTHTAMVGNGMAGERDWQVNRAAYAAEWTAHTELEKIGLPGAYCHFTSPIRRGPDYYNGAMVHYACDVKRKIEERTWAGTSLDIDHEAEHLLWHQMPDILHALQEAQSDRDNEGKQLALKEELRKAVNLLCRKDPPPPPEIYERHGMSEWPERNVDHEYNEVMKLTPPITKSNLAGAMQEINTLNDLERDAWRDPELRAHYRKGEYGQAIRDYAPATLAAMDKRAFSQVIRKAALSGEMSDAVRDEILERAKDADHKLSKAWDAMHILIAARDHEGEDWRKLRKAMIRAVRADLSAVNNVLDLAEKVHFLPEGSYEEIEEGLPTLGAESKGFKETPFIRTAILKTVPDGEAPPFYSVGYDHHSAITHARYSFLEHYAFKDLHPMEEAALPNLLYADIGESAAEKEGALRSLVEEQGGELKILHRAPEETVIEGEKAGESYRTQHCAVVKVSGEDFGAKELIARSYADTQEAATQSALRKLLSKPKFKHAVQALTSQEVEKFMRAEETLHDAVKERGWDMSVRTDPYQVRSRHYCDAKVSIYTDQGLYVYEASAQNQKSAVHEACVKAIMENPILGVELNIPQLARNSWLGRSVVSDGGEERLPPPRRGNAKQGREVNQDGSPKMPEIRVSFPEGTEHVPPTRDAAEMIGLQF